jgi:hypothetical protein
MSNDIVYQEKEGQQIELYSREFLEKISAFKRDWRKVYKRISKENTPQVDGSGRKIIGKKGNYDFIIASYMIESLDKHFPGWSWESAAPIQFLGAEWVVAQGHLLIIDEYLIPFGINPPYRKFYGVGAHRIVYPRDAKHEVANIVDINNDVKSANTEAQKVAINRLTHIGDDVYGKRIEEEGAGSLEDVVMNSGNSTDFGKWVQDNKVKWSYVFEVLGIKSINEIVDYKDAIVKIKKAKGWS